MIGNRTGYPLALTRIAKLERDIREGYPYISSAHMNHERFLSFAYVKPEVCDIPILDYVVFAFQALQAFLRCGSK